MRVFFSLLQADYKSMFLNKIKESKRT